MLNSRLIHHQLAAAVVRDGNGHTVEGAVIRNAGDFIGGDNLGDVVLISAGFREGDTSEVKVDSRSVGVSLTRHLVLSIAYAIRFSSIFGQRSTRGDSLQLEGKGIAVPPIAALQNLFSPERIIGVVVIRVYRNFLGFIGVGHRDFLGCTCRDRAGVVINALLGIAFGQLIFRLRDSIGAAYGQAHNLGSLAVFQGESAAVLDGFGFLSAGNSILVLGIGVHIIARQLKLHRKVGVCARVQAFVGFNLLGNLHAACGIHGQLTVVAKVQHTHVCGKVPLEVNAAFGGICLVLRLTAQLAVNGGGQAAFFGALFDIALTRRILFYALRDGLIRINVHGNHIGLGKRFITVVRVLMQVVQLIVIGFARFKSGDRLTLFGIQQGVLGMIVEAIACCRGKGGSGRADGFFAICRFFGGIKFVGVEADLAVFGICCNIAGKCVIGYIAGRDLAAHIDIVLKADRVDDADGLGIRNRQRRVVILISCNLIIPQGQHTGRDLDLHRIAGTAAATGDSDKDMAQIGFIGVSVAGRAGIFVRKGVGIYGFTVAIGASCLFGVLVNTTGKGNGLKAFDLHIIAQGIIEGHIAAICRVIANHFRGAGQINSHRIENSFKDLVQPVSAGSRQIVIWIGGLGAEVPAIAPPITGVSGLGIVAGDCVHELVFARSPLAGDAGSRVSTAENANGINFAATLLDFISRCDGTGSYRGAKFANLGRRAIRKEDDDLFGIFARRRRCQRSLGTLHAIIRTGSTGRFYGIYIGFERINSCVLADSKPLHNLRIVICVHAVFVEIIANLGRAIACKFHDGKPDFLILIRDFLILLRSAVNKVSDGLFQRVNALCGIPFAHGIVHTAGGIQHQHYIQRLCIGGSGRRMGGQRRQRDQEISAFIFGHRDGILACQVAAEGDLFFLHRFIGPNTAGGGVVIGLCELPRIKRVGIADGSTVGSSLCRGVFPLCIGRDRNQHREQERQRQQGGLQPYEFTVHNFYSILSLCCGDIYK